MHTQLVALFAVAKAKPPMVHMPRRVSDIVEEEAARCGVTAETFRGRTRSKALADARHRCWARIRQLRRADGRQFSYPQIGRWFDNRDHTSVMGRAQRRVARATGEALAA